MLDEMLLAGELQEPSKKAVTRVIEVQVRRRVKGNSCACQTPQTLRLSCAPRHTLRKHPRWLSCCVVEQKSMLVPPWLQDQLVEAAKNPATSAGLAGLAMERARYS